MATRWTLPQGDLFEPSPPVSQLMETERRKALDLLQALLAEAINLAPETAIKSRRRRAMTKITPEHLARSAVVYVRQSTADSGRAQPGEPASAVWPWPTELASWGGPMSR